MAAATCPHCDEAVTVPAGVQPETRVACPLCQEELTGEDFIGQLPPALVLLDTAAVVVAEESPGPATDDDFDPENPFGEVREAQGGAAVVTRVRRTGSTGSRKKSGGARQIISIVLGGMLALPIAQMILWQLDRDPVGLADSFENVRWMHWAMPSKSKKKWAQKKNPDAEGEDTSTSGLPPRRQPPRLSNPSRESVNGPDMVIDLNDLERKQAGGKLGGGRGLGAGPGSTPNVPAPEPEPLPKPGWINDAPLFGASILKPMLNQTRQENKEWDARPEDLEPAARRRLDEGFYAMLAQMGLGITFSDETDPESREITTEIGQLLTSFRHNEEKLQLIAEHGQFKFSFPQDGLRGIALYGTITSIDENEPYFETTLVIQGEKEATDVVVISRVNPAPDLKPGQQVVILGAAILNPSENINGYQGDAEQLVIGGYPVVTKQP
ncbi:MAG: hypothetical protein VYB09_00745 [Planctomycetota bacterium]|nr:hypothetical protein [Planctomycetota bacterium]